MQTDVLNQSLRDKGNPYWYWVSLIFSSFYFLPIFFNPSAYSKTDISFSILAYIVFIYLYNLCTKAKEEEIYVPTGAILLLCAIATNFNPGAYTLFAFTAFFIGFCLPKRKSLTSLAVIFISISLSAFLFLDKTIYFIIPGWILSIGLYAFGYLERYERLHQLSKAKSQEQIEQLAKIAERERIARDLHDLLGHSLSSIALKSELAEKLLLSNKAEEAGKEISAVADLSRSILSEVRQAVSGFKQQALKGILSNLKKELESANFQVLIQNTPNTLPPKIESALTLIIKEIVTNTLRHSKGDKIDFQFNQNNNILELTVLDNGYVEKVKWGNGLLGIQERCELLLGNFSTEITNNKLQLSLNLPLHSNP